MHNSLTVPLVAPSRVSRGWRFWASIAGGLAVAVLLAYVGLLAANWPYRQKAVIPALERIFQSRIEVQHYRMFFFPRPGFMAEGLTMRYRGDTNGPPLATAQEVIAKSDYHDIFFQTGHCRMLTVQGARVVLGRSVSGKESFGASATTRKNVSKTIVDVLTVQGAEITIATDPMLSHLPFRIDWLTLRNVTHDRAIDFSVTMKNPIPAGRLEASGSVGPIRPQSAGGTPASGSYRLENADLSPLKGFGGKVSSSGIFRGKLNRLDVRGNVAVPDFHVPSGQPVPLAVVFHALVDAPNKDIVLGPLQATCRHTTLFAQGGITGKPKTTSMDFAVDRGRVEDLMRVFMIGEPPVRGPIVLRAHAVLPAGPQPFLDRLQLTGHFTLPDTGFVQPDVRKSIRDFNQHAAAKPGSHAATDWETRGDPPTGDAAEMDGQAAVFQGVAHGTDLHFRMTGLTARMRGTYVLQGGRTHLVGVLRTQRSLSHDTSSGWKALLLKPLAPLFRHKHAGAQIPIAITGDKRHYNIGMSLTGGK